MGRMTIRSIWNDMVISSHEWDKWNDAVDTPIVPRKMVEMIIAKCNCNIQNGRTEGYTDIRDFAEALLRMFEEGDNE